MRFKECRPPGYFSNTDRTLAKLCRKVEEFLSKQPYSLTNTLPPAVMKELSHMIVEFAEDTYFEVGMWESLEKWNQKHFGNPLPFSKPESEEHSDFPFDEYRLAHFLWNALLIFRADDYFSPFQMELLPLAEKLSYFLEEQFGKIVGQSSVGKFLSSPNKDGVAVKSKLVWLGSRSYLFRLLLTQYLYDNDALKLPYQKQIAYLDDFFCQECTLWSGMGVLDVLVECIPLSDSQKQEVNSWYERHMAYYEVIEAGKTTLKARNLLIDTIYEIDDQKGAWETSFFREGMLLFGATVPFDGKWYWSGQQYRLGSIDKVDIDQYCKEFREKNVAMLYRYDKKRLKKAKKQMKDYEKAFLAFFGSDLVEFETGKEVAEALFEKMKFQQKEILKDKFEEQMKMFEDKKMTAESMYPSEFLESEGGFCVFHNPGIGDEIATNFHDVKAALQGEGEPSIEKSELLQGLMQADEISVAFIRRLVQEYGNSAFAKAFYLHKRPKYWFEYLLRKYKGQNFRNQYPKLGIIDP